MSHDIFKRNPNLEVVYQTSDQQCFYHESDARNHAKTLENKSVETLKKGSAEEKPAQREYALNAKDTIAKIRAVESLEGLEEFADDERKSVIDAIVKRTEELSAPVEESTNTEEDEAEN